VTAGGVASNFGAGNCTAFMKAASGRERLFLAADESSDPFQVGWCIRRSIISIASVSLGRAAHRPGIIKYILWSLFLVSRDWRRESGWPCIPFRTPDGKESGRSIGQQIFPQEKKLGGRSYVNEVQGRGSQGQS